MAKPVPFAKRFPGRHAVSATIVLPSGSRIEITGPFPRETAELVLSMLTADTTSERAQALIAELTRELDDGAARARQASEPDASGSVDQSVTPVGPATSGIVSEAKGSAGGGVAVTGTEVDHG